uniref:Putative ixodegrins large 9 n=1 Tax=Amblyomma cajennense TaxID=34607 RepID=A0A023FPV7_AMBCJ
MRCLLANGVVLLLLIAMHEVTAYHYGVDWDGLVQRRIKNGRERGYFYRRRYRGEFCENSDDCFPGLCCVQRLYRTCQPLSWYGQRCGLGQIKGGCYWNHCPCVYGDDFCHRGFCQA